MTRAPRERLPSCEADLVVQVTDDGSRTIVRAGECGADEERSAEDAYHSASGALAETRHVYLENSGVADRLRGGRPTRVLEVGLGTGMGWLMTLDLAAAHGAPLRYVALENRWLSAETIRRLEPQHWVMDPELARRFLRWRGELPESIPDGRYRWHAGDQCELEVCLGDARQWTPQPGERFDAIYFDPFAPTSNPELWQPAVLARMRGVLHRAGRLTTYCVSRSVRDAFASAGFTAERVPGPPGGKREVLVARAT